jgi:hypothetical protein
MQLMWLLPTAVQNWSHPCWQAWDAMQAVTKQLLQQQMLIMMQ